MKHFIRFAICLYSINNCPSLLYSCQVPQVGHLSCWEEQVSMPHFEWTLATILAHHFVSVKQSIILVESAVVCMTALPPLFKHTLSACCCDSFRVGCQQDDVMCVTNIQGQETMELVKAFDAVKLSITIFLVDKLEKEPFEEARTDENGHMGTCCWDKSVHHSLRSCETGLSLLGHEGQRALLAVFWTMDWNDPW